MKNTKKQVDNKIPFGYLIAFYWLKNKNKKELKKIYKDINSK